MAKELLAPQTGAGPSASFAVFERHEATFIMFSPASLVAAEYGDVQISHNGGTTWQDVYQEGTQFRLASDNNVATIFGPGLYRIDKDVTTNPVGIYVSYDRST